jgi:hypothetical protein
VRARIGRTSAELTPPPRDDCRGPRPARGQGLSRRALFCSTSQRCAAGHKRKGPVGGGFRAPQAGVGAVPKCVHRTLTVPVATLPPSDDRDYGRAVRGRRRTGCSAPHRPSKQRERNSAHRCLNAGRIKRVIFYVDLLVDEASTSRLAPPSSRPTGPRASRQRL